MNFPFISNIDSLDEMRYLAEELSGVFKEGDIVVLNGELGSGKTTLIKFICKFYKIENVLSPSFSIVNEYKALKKVFHFDFYRLKKIEELFDIGFEDYINDSEAIIFIEWGNLMEGIIPLKHYKINLDFRDGEKRKIHISMKNG